MSAGDLEQIVGQSPIFHGLDTAALTDALDRGRLRNVDAGGIFMHQGEPALTFHVLVHGHVKLVQVTPDGHEILARFVRPGQEFGIIAALSGFEYPMSALAIDDCQALVWSGEVMAQMIEQNKNIAFNVMRTLVMRNLSLQRRYQGLLTKSVEQRVARALLNLLPAMGREIDSGILIDMPLTEEDLATLTGTTIYSVSRILNEWERLGIVETSRRRIVVCNPPLLEPIAAP